MTPVENPFYFLDASMVHIDRNRCLTYPKVASYRDCDC